MSTRTAGPRRKHTGSTRLQVQVNSAGGCQARVPEQDDRGSLGIQRSINVNGTSCLPESRSDRPPPVAALPPPRRVPRPQVNSLIRCPSRCVADVGGVQGTPRDARLDGWPAWRWCK
jgi:hypothetical protein